MPWTETLAVNLQEQPALPINVEYVIMPSTMPSINPSMKGDKCFQMENNSEFSQEGRSKQFPHCQVSIVVVEKRRFMLYS